MQCVLGGCATAKWGCPCCIDRTKTEPGLEPIHVSLFLCECQPRTPSYTKRYASLRFALRSAHARCSGSHRMPGGAEARLATIVFTWLWGAVRGQR